MYGDIFQQRHIDCLLGVMELGTTNTQPAVKKDPYAIQPFGQVSHGMLLPTVVLW